MDVSQRTLRGALIFHLELYTEQSINLNLEYSEDYYTCHHLGPESKHLFCAQGILLSQSVLKIMIAGEGH